MADPGFWTCGVCSRSNAPSVAVCICRGKGGHLTEEEYEALIVRMQARSERSSRGLSQDIKALLSELEQLRKENERLRQGLELTRNSVVLIMAREGCSLEMDRDAKFSALKQIDAALEDSRRLENP